MTWPAVPLMSVASAKSSLVGSATTVKFNELAMLVLPLTNVIGPVRAPVGTDVVMTAVVELKANCAAVPLNSTPVTRSRFTPLMVTLVPAGPATGTKEVTPGCCSRRWSATAEANSSSAFRAP